MVRGIAENVRVLSRSKRSGKVEVAVTTNGYTKTRHGVAITVEGKPAIRVAEPGIGEVYLILPSNK